MATSEKSEAREGKGETKLATVPVVAAPVVPAVAAVNSTDRSG